MRIAPYAWRINGPQESCFDVYYNDLTVPDQSFKELLRVNRATFDAIFNILDPKLDSLQVKYLLLDCIGWHMAIPTLVLLLHFVSDDQQLLRQVKM